MRAFSGHLQPQELLILWDLILGYDSLEILALLAIIILSFRKESLMQVSSIESIEVSYSGKFIASQGKDGKLVIHNLESEKIIFQKTIENFKLFGITNDERFVLVDGNNYRYLLSPYQPE